MKRIFVVLAVVCTMFGVSEYVMAQGPAGDVFTQEGIASWYGPEFDGRPTASGEIFDSNLLTAAHPSLPFGTILVVTSKQNNRKVTVKVNDRGPFIPNRIIDLSRAAAIQLDMLSTGIALVAIESVERLVLPKPNSVSVQPPPAQPVQQSIPVYVIHPIQSAPSVHTPPPVQTVQPATEPIQAVQPPVSQPVQPPSQQITQTVTQTVPETPVPQTAPPVQVYAPVYNQQPPVYPPQQSVTPIIVYAPAMQPALPPLAASPPATSVPEYTAPAAPVSEYAAPAPAYRSGVKLTPAISPEANKTYKMQVGSYKIPRNAVEVYEKLKNAGLDPSYERNENLFRVVLPGIKGSEIQSAVEKLEAAGFHEALIREER